MFRYNAFRPYAAALSAVLACAAPASASAAGTYTVLHTFNGSDGLEPQGHLFYDYINGAPVVIGATEAGGSGNSGTIFTYNLKTAAFGTQATFSGPPASQTPIGGVTIDLSNNKSIVGEIVGTTSNGGTTNSGTLYTVSLSGTYADAYSFGQVANPNDPASPLDGASPFGVLAEDIDGNFYGTTSAGGAGSSGTVFQYNPVSGAVTTLYTFGNNPAVLDGQTPLEGLTLGSTKTGILYGTTSSGGAYGEGTVYSVTPSGTVTTLYSFTGGNDGANPQCLVALDSKGNLYGTAPSGGADGDGTLWELSTSNVFSVLHTFTGVSDGAAPLAGVAFGDKYRMYGTTSASGKHGYGTIFEYNLANPSFSVQRSFLSSSDGGSPNGQLLIGPNNTFFGTTTTGGKGGFGTFFQFTPATGS